MWVVCDGKETLGWAPLLRHLMHPPDLSASQVRARR